MSYVYLFVAFDEIVKAAGVLFVVVLDELVEAHDLRFIEFLEPTYLSHRLLNRILAEKDTNV